MASARSTRSSQTLHAQGSNVVGRLSVPGVRPKLDANGEIADLETIAQTCVLVDALVDAAQAARRTVLTKSSSGRLGA